MKTPLLWLWTLVAVACCTLMWLLPGSETVPYHVAWATFALCYGLERWRPWATALGLALYTAVSGFILIDRVVEGVIDWQETAEIPLMSLLIALMVWHVQRRQRLLMQVTVLADRERAEASARELLTQRTSHEMRSPLTIANGYLEVLMSRHHDAETAEDLGVIHEELARLNRACDRLIRSLRVAQKLANTDLDVDAIARDTAKRWSGVATRAWRVDARGGTVVCSAERVRACLDTLVENALRYTKDGDTIEIYARRVGGTLLVGVADSGPGFSDQLLEAVKRPRFPDDMDDMRDSLSQTGLGIGLVFDVARRRGGELVLGRSPHGGADIALSMPIDLPRSDRQGGSGEQRLVRAGLVTS